MKYNISLIVPVYNEEEIILSSLRKNIDILDNNSCEFEIIVVDDGSNDNSWNIIQSLAKDYPFLRIYRHDKNKGFGATIRTGISHSKMQYILCIPADSPLNEETFNSIRTNLGKADVLLSYRRKRLGYSWWMKLNSNIYHFLISRLFHLNFKDYNWIHAYHRKVFDIGNIQIENDGIFMLAEIIIKARDKKYSFVEFPVDQVMRITGHASSAKPNVMLRTFTNMLRFYRIYKSQ